MNHIISKVKEMAIDKANALDLESKEMLPSEYATETGGTFNVKLKRNFKKIEK